MTMPNRERAELLKKEVDGAYSESWDLQARAQVFNKAFLATVLEILKEEKLLAKCQWQFNSFSMYLTLSAMGDWKDFPEIVNLLEPGYHDSYRLTEEGPNLLFSDGEVHLELERETASQMIQDLGITIVHDNLEDKRKKLVAQLKDLTELITLVEGLNE